jgi:hypothetical protein
VDAGSTVIAIEHNLDVIPRADWVIDLSQGAGHDGGQVQFEAVLADLAMNGIKAQGKTSRWRAASRHGVDKGDGSPGRTRTSDPAVNSRLLYRLSYRGIGRSL